MKEKYKITRNSLIRELLRSGSLMYVFISLFWLIPDIQFCFALGFISGTVRSESGIPLSGVKVKAIVFEGQYQYISTFTDENGDYKIDSLDICKYILRTFNTLDYMDEYYDNVYAKADAYVFKILHNSEFQNIDFELCNDGGGYIEGTVLIEGSTTPIEGVSMQFINTNTRMEHIARSGTDGYYKSSLLPLGTYYIFGYGAPKGYFSEYFDNKEVMNTADVVAVSEAGICITANFELKEIKSGIAGNVYIEETGDPIDDAWVIAYSPAWSWQTDTRTNPNGSYLLKGLPEGDYYVKVSGIDHWSYFTEFYDNACEQNSAELVVIVKEKITPNINFYIEKVTTQKIFNEHIGIAVTDKYDGSNMSVGNTGGLPDSQEDDDANLISDYPKPEMSYTSIWLDGSIIRFGSFFGERLQAPEISEDGKSITRSWRLNGIKIIQKASLIESPWSLMHYEDTARLEYIIVNQDALEHEVGLRILLDTMLGDTDGVPISVPDHPLIFNEQEFFKVDMPPLWRAIKCETTPEGDTINVSFSAQGTIKNYGATCPDRFVIAKYNSIDRRDNYWDYAINDNLRITEDSAVALWWHPKKIAASDTIRIVTYYGLGQGVPDREPPQIVEYVPEKYSTVYPDTPIRFTITDNKTGVDTNSVIIKINNKPASLRFEGPLDSLSVFCTFQEIFKCNQTIAVFIDTLSDNGVPPNKCAADSFRFYIISDNEPPKITNHYPLNGAPCVDINTNIEITLEDSPAGIDRESLKLFINDVSVIHSCEITSSDTAVHINYQPDNPFQLNDTVRVTVGAIDLADPPNPMNDPGFTFYTFKNDSVPPYVEFICPANDSQNVQPDTRIIINLKDDIAGVDTNSVAMWVNDAPVAPQFDSTLQNLHVVYNADRDTLFNFEELIRVKLEASDTAGNPMKLFYSKFTIMSKFFKDTLPPYISSHFPVNKQREVDMNAAIRFRIQDDHSGVDKQNVKMKANSEWVRVQTVAGDSLNYLFEYYPQAEWRYNDSVNVEIFAQDLADSANIMQPYSFKFYTQSDTIKPGLSNIIPVPYSRNVSPYTLIQFIISDSISGVNIESLNFSVDEKPVHYNCSGDSSSYNVWYRPSIPFDEGQTVKVAVSATDLAAQANLVDSTWEFTTVAIVDTVPPYTENHSPAPFAENVSPETEISVQIVDTLSGVDSSSIEMEINALRVSPRITISHDLKRVTLRYQYPNGFRYNEIVKVHLKASDLAKEVNDMTEEYWFKIKPDTFPPYITDFKPGGANVNPATNISFDVRDDDAGVDSASIKVFINGSIKIPNIERVNSKQYHVEYQPAERFKIGQTVTVIVEAADLAFPPDSVRKTYSFKIQEYLPDLAVTEFITIPARDIKMNNLFKISASVRNSQVAVKNPFHITFYVGEQSLKDTVLASMESDEIRTIFARTQLPAGVYRLKVQVDSEDQVIESSETNNYKDIAISIAEGNLVVRPNPFTPNNDGYNDDAIFNFQEMTLVHPELKLFSFEGQEIASLEPDSDKLFKWNGRDRNGSESQPGIYLYVLFDNKKIVTKGSLVLAR